MLKKTMLALLAVIFAVALTAPAKANAQVIIGVGGRPFAARLGPVVVAPYAAPYVAPYAASYAAPAPYVAVAPAYAYSPYVYPAPVVVGAGWYHRDYAYRGYRHYGWRR